MAAKTCFRDGGRISRVHAALKGLTLIEMLVVIGICGTMALLLVPMVLRARSNSRTVVCANNLKGLGQAYAVCLNNSGNYFPEAYYTYEGADGEYIVSIVYPVLSYDQPRFLETSLPCGNAWIYLPLVVRSGP